MPNDENKLARDAGGENTPCHYHPLAENLGTPVGSAGKVDLDAMRIGGYLVKLCVRQHEVITA